MDKTKSINLSWEVNEKMLKSGKTISYQKFKRINDGIDALIKDGFADKTIEIIDTSVKTGLIKDALDLVCACHILFEAWNKQKITENMKRAMEDLKGLAGSILKDVKKKQADVSGSVKIN